ncbi:MAG: anaerobic sulfatase maturase [Clostridia bacterium]|nr:MAG: anaerobic sulfatase maturase [Clostridia bacterium]
MKFLSILVKPVSGACNLDCKYCFYKELAEELCDHQRMSFDTAHTLIDKALASGAQEVLFAFQGGEPLLAGADFYQDFTDYVASHIGNTKVSYSVQTNGTLINDAYIQLFLQHNFLVGVSLDGPKFVHDKYRLTPKGGGTFETVLTNARKMQDAGVAVNILTVITNESALRAKKLYSFYRKYSFEFIQFIPCMDSIQVEQGSLDTSLTSENYLKFLCELFKLWYRDLTVGNYVSIRHFDNWVRLMQHRSVDTCSLSGQCGSYFVVEANADVYPCDFYVTHEWLLGSIFTHDFSQMLTALEQSGFLVQSHLTRSEACADCPNENLCRGGCKRDWVYEGQQGRSRYCAALNAFFTRYRGHLAAIARALR